MPLHDCLNHYPYRTLTVIARLWQIEGLRNIKKSQLIERLTETLLDVNHLASTVQQLSPDAMNALAALINAGGSLPWLDFRQRYGDIRPYKPWNNKQKNNYDLTNVSPAEQLAYLGLIYRHPRRPKPAQTQKIIIPSDLLSLLPSLKSTPTVATPHINIDHATLLFDLTTFLSFIHQQQPKALYNGRWLSPKNVEHINQIIQPNEPTKPSSELQSTRVRFIHFLADSAGLITVIAEQFTLTPQATQWLSASKEQQYQQLWQASQAQTAAQAERWQRYRYPELPQIKINTSQTEAESPVTYNLPTPPPEEPLKLLHCLSNHLATCKSQESYQLTTFLTHLWAIESKLWKLEIPFQQAVQRKWIKITPPDAGFALIEESPPNRGGWLEWDKEPWNDGTRKSVTIPSHIKAFITELMQTFFSWWGVLQFDQTATHFTLTPLADWLLGNRTQPITAPPAQFQIQKIKYPSAAVTELIITMPPTVSAESRLRLEAITERQEGNTYHLTPKSLAQGIRLGMSLSQIVTFLEQESEGGLSKKQSQLIQSWSTLIDEVRLQHVTLLETNNPALMTELTRHRNVSKHIQRTLSRRAVVIDEAHLEKIRRHIEREGHPLVDTLAPTTFGQRKPDSADEAAYFLLAIHVYRQLAQWIELPQKIPYALSGNLSTQLSPAAKTAAEQAAHQVSERIKHAIDGYAPRYPNPEQTLPQEQTLPLIEQALQQGDYLDITYWSAGRGERTHRTIEPYRLEWHRQIPYLIAYCQQAHAERRFRLDRIEAIQLIANDNAAEEEQETIEDWWFA